jgi:hypothetical protein
VCAPSGAALDESGDVAFANNFGVLRGEVEEVGLVRTRIAIADRLAHNVRNECSLYAHGPGVGRAPAVCGAVAAAEMSPPIGALDRQAVEGRPCLAAIESRIVFL